MSSVGEAMVGIHSAGAPTISPVVVSAQHARAFGSMRFDGVVPVAAEQLKEALATRGVHLQIINMLGGEDIDQAVIEGIESCSAFIVFGSARYGQNTGNAACTYYESKYAQDRKKNIILIRMIPFDEDFEYPQARFMFGLNKLELPWLLGTPMPSELPDKIAEAMGQAPPSAASDRVSQPSAALAPTTGGAAAAAAAAWPAELKDLVSIPAFVSCLAGMEVHSLADFGETVDFQEGHDKMMLAVLDALPAKPKKNRAIKVRAQRCLGDLLAKFRTFDELDTDGDCELSREECASALTSQLATHSGGSLIDHFDAITGGTRLLNFSDFFAHVVIVCCEGVPLETTPEPEPSTTKPRPETKPLTATAARPAAAVRIIQQKSTPHGGGGVAGGGQGAATAAQVAKRKKAEPSTEQLHQIGQRLVAAVSRGRLDDIRALLDQGAPVAFTDECGDDALHQAAMAGRNDVIDLLVSRGADVNTRNDYDRTPLILAAWKGHVSTCSDLLSLGADPTLKNKAGATALDGAKRYGQAECVAVLQPRLEPELATPKLS
jgi:hypothetical protein